MVTFHRLKATYYYATSYYSSLNSSVDDTGVLNSRIPPGYSFYGTVEFTDSPNWGRPHLHLATAEESVDHPEEASHTILVTPDGRAYSKP